MSRLSRQAGEFATPVRTLVLASTCAVFAVPMLAGCTDNTATDNAGAAANANPRALTVQSTDTECKVSANTAPSGPLTFAVTNGGSKVTEFYLYGEDGLRIIGEVENIGPGITRELVMRVEPGSYITACKPGMIGEGIRAPFSVSDSGEEQQASGNDAELVEEANKKYGAYVRDQTDQLVAGTAKFVAAYKAGDDDQARAIYPVARMHWERIETVAESFGDLDPKLDLREADLEPGQKWTGWHRIEKDLWPARAKNYEPLSKAQRVTYSDDLVKNTAILHDRVQDLSYSADDIANGSRALLDEVATGKVTGEEEYWSRTDLWDFQANIEGARVAFEGLRPLLQQKNPDLDSQIAAKFAAVQALLDAQRVGDGFKTYDKLSKAEIKELSDAVNALSEPLSKLAAAVV
ncbi:MAG TPA: iron uptake system protein EfeO [Propionibacteriaceae bacterium]|nr:iron uptake system protein EfeO [Propionibacteriaceae bacterium]